MLRTFSVATTSVFEAEESLLKTSLVLLTCSSFLGLLAVGNEGDLELLSVVGGGRAGTGGGSEESSGGGRDVKEGVWGGVARKRT